MALGKATHALAYALLVLAVTGCPGGGESTGPVAAAPAPKPTEDAEAKACAKSTRQPKITAVNAETIELSPGETSKPVSLTELFSAQNLPAGMTIKIGKKPDPPVKLVSQSATSVTFGVNELRHDQFLALDKGPIETSLEVLAMDPVCGIEQPTTIKVKVVKPAVQTASLRSGADLNDPSFTTPVSGEAHQNPN